MRIIEKLNAGWKFVDPEGKEEDINIPHTWNRFDGQNGGNNYWRGSCTYRKCFGRPEKLGEKDRLFLEFNGVNASAAVTINGVRMAVHDGGYSTFYIDITEQIHDENVLVVEVSNAVNDRVYPQKADFTFYGGIYRDVNLILVDQHHFSFGKYGDRGLKITPLCHDDQWIAEIETQADCEGEVQITVTDQDGKMVGTQNGRTVSMGIDHAHLWNGVKDPYLYTAEAVLLIEGEEKDRVSCRFGLRTFRVDPEQGFFLNGKSYPLHGVSRHQDWKDCGNALSKEQHLIDMHLMAEMGTNTIRLAHYQHDSYFYDLCDEYGMVVWAEIPYISEHMPAGRENTISQMKELIIQNYNHPSIVCWGISNEITISTRDHRDMMDNHRQLNELCHTMDPTRFTTLACYAMCSPFNPVVHNVSDVVSYNYYLGWYTPFLWLNDVFLNLFHRIWPKRCMGYSEYGAEGMPNLHAASPKRGDQTEEYQAIYHEYMLECFARHPFLWSTHVWNMFDFASDARDQGGEAGMNHKGLVTFDRQIKKDSFYVYKAWWSQEPFVYLCGRRYRNRKNKQNEIKIYSNQKEVTLYQNGKPVGTKTGSHVFCFPVQLEQENKFEAVAGGCHDQMQIFWTDKEDPSYRLTKKSGQKSRNWV